MSEKLIASLHPFERKVLPLLKKHTEVKELAEVSGLQEVQVIRALQWLQNRELCTIEKEEIERIFLGKNGEQYKEQGLPEKRLLKELASSPKTIQELSLPKEEKGIAVGTLKKKGAISMEAGKLSLTEDGTAMLTTASSEETFLEKSFPLSPSTLSEQEMLTLKELQKRKDIVEQEKKKVITAVLTKKGKDLAAKKIDTEVEEALTHDMLKNGTWKGKTFRRYDVEINVPPVTGGRRHFVNEALEYARKVWMDMGFQEMTGDFVQTSFWNFDALFTPQDHPVRDMQDTFFVDTQGTLPKEKVKEVKEAHQKGVAGSRGWGGDWEEEEAAKPVLRTHTTVLSALTLAKQETYPAKYFALGKCFRNEALDWSHLFEFNQTDGIVIDPNANFRNLLGYLKAFFKKMGFPEARFRPAYFPYTEPSVEIDVWDEHHGKWLELGGAGMLRPEVVIPLLGKDIPVLAWGPGFDRLILDFHKINDIRELYKNELEERKAWTR